MADYVIDSSSVLAFAFGEPGAEVVVGIAADDDNHLLISSVNMAEVLVKMIDKGIPRHDYEIRDAAGKAIGKVTSGTMSPVLGIGIGLGYVTTGHSAPGSEIFIVVRNNNLKALVHKLPLL